ncbi:hypothetical protein V6V47_22915 [Micromonospora sp. CPCC 205539]|uniref:hypothetical protein n=1 Tax=Micromonospora sp. CPCC 205539 TaxID=3122408 RepID=UPI002FF121EA
MTGRRATRLLLAAGVLLTLLTAGCGVRPSAVITGSAAQAGQSEGIHLYLVWRGQLALVIRPTNVVAAPAVSHGALADGPFLMLAEGPDESERGRGLTSEVPAGLVPTAPVVAKADGLTVTVNGAVTSLSAIAAAQIVCTVADNAALTGQGTRYAPVTLVGSDGVRPPRSCPIK